MKRGLFCIVLALTALLVCLWLGVIPWTTSDDPPPTQRPASENSLENPDPGDLPEGENMEADGRAPEPEALGVIDASDPDADKVVLSGYTLDQRDRPVAGAHVGLLESESQCGGSAYSFLGLHTWLLPRAGGSLADLTPAGLLRIAATESDRDGYFEFRVHRSDGTYDFRCVGPERSAYYLGGPFSPADSPVKLRLDPVHELRGLVRDAESEARVAGATVELVEEDVNTRREEWGHIGERSRARRTSDVDGMFRVDLLPAGRYRLDVLHPDYPAVFRQFVEIPIEDDPVVVSLPSARGDVVISGRISDAITGFGVGGAEISDTIGRHRVISAPSGEYSMHLEAARMKHGLTLTASAPGYGDAMKLFRGPVHSEEWDIALQAARRLICLVVTSGERPVAGAKVFLSATIEIQPGSVSTGMHSRMTGGDGLCEFAELPAIEKVEVFAFHPEHGSAYVGDVPLSENDEPARVTLDLIKGPVTVVVSVRDLEGAPVPEAPVLLLQPRHPLPETVVRTSIVLRGLGRMGNLRMARTDARGRAKFPDVLPGDTLVQAIGKGHLTDGMDGREDSVRSEVFRFVAEPGTGKSCELTIWSTYRLYGRVRTPEGEALQGVLVRLLGWNDEHDWVLESPMALSNGFGNYSFKGLSPVKRLAIGVRPSGLGGGDQQWKSWKKVSAGEKTEPGLEEQEYWSAQEFSVNPTVPKELLFFSEITPPETGDARVDIVLELPPR